MSTSCVDRGLTMGPADPALGRCFRGSAKLLKNVGQFSENLTEALAKTRFRLEMYFLKIFIVIFAILPGFDLKGSV